MTGDLQDRARQIAAAPYAYASADISAIINELLAAVEGPEAAHRRLCGPCNGTGRHFPYALLGTLSYGRKCAFCDGSGMA